MGGTFFSVAGEDFPLSLRQMIQRYSRPQMREIWTEQRKLEIWLQVELLAAEALVQELEKAGVPC
jgi:hypothetical protein